MANAKKKSANTSPEMCERAVRIVFDNTKNYPRQSAAIKSIAAKCGCGKSSLSCWVRQAQAGQGVKPPLPTLHTQAKSVRRLRSLNVKFVSSVRLMKFYEIAHGLFTFNTPRQQGLFAVKGFGKISPCFDWHFGNFAAAG